MKNVLCRSLILALGVALVASAAFAKSVSNGRANYDFQSVPTGTLVNPDVQQDAHTLPAPGAGTLELYQQEFETGASCTVGGWTLVDITAQIANYFHVDDYVTGGVLAGYAPIQGAQSLWCGTRPGGGALCGYVSLPGYGNGWNQGWCTRQCIPIAGGAIDWSFDAIFDSEPGYDATTLEYTATCSGVSGWTAIDGGTSVWDGNLPVANYAGAFATASTPVKIRLHFQSDTAWSDQDGFWPTNGAAHFDNLQVEGLPLENFEGEAFGATGTTDAPAGWAACLPAAFGQYMALFPGTTVLQEDPCAKDLQCLWSAINGSSETYLCGGFPGQKAIPKGVGSPTGLYLSNEVWSPNIPLIGAGSVILLKFLAYRDMPLDNLTFYIWHVRTIVAGCPGAWKDLNFVYFGGQKDWLQQTQSIGALVNLATGTDINIALGVIDQCGVWCPNAANVGSGACHSHAPLLDTVRVYRVNTLGPQWTIRDIDQFQDSFAKDGTLTGWVRADEAIDLLPRANPSILPGDSAVVTVADPTSGIANDLVNGGKKIYIWFSIWPQVQPAAKIAAINGGPGLTQNPARFPWVGNNPPGTPAGQTWYCLRLDQAILNGNPVANVFCIDLNDCLFTPCDTICYFFCAENTNGVRTYAYGSNLGTQGGNVADAFANPSEFTCLPAGGWKRGGDVLYVDGMDGRGAQPFFDTAFQQLGLLDKVDRYDVRGPSSSVNNRLAGRVYNVGVQLLNCYRKIVWDCGDLGQTLGDGTHSAANPEKTNDYGLVNTFLNNLANPGGVYICGDDVGFQLNASGGASAVTFKTTYLTYTLTTGNHKPTFGVAPLGRGTAGNCFNGDSFYIFGGCPLINDFDVMGPTGSTVMEVSYAIPATATNGAVLSKRTTNSNNVQVGVLFSGFSFIYLKDDENDGILDRADHMHDILVWLGNNPPQPTGSGPIAKNDLSQNYPNPFNPQTTIAFSVKDRGTVSLKVYNVAGQLVRTLADESFTAGAHVKVWDGRDDAGQTVSSGVYFYKLVTNNFSQTKKMVLLK